MYSYDNMYDLRVLSFVGLEIAMVYCVRKLSKMPSERPIWKLTQHCGHLSAFTDLVNVLTFLYINESLSVQIVAISYFLRSECFIIES